MLLGLCWKGDFSVPKKNKERADWAITEGRVSRWQKEQKWQRIIVVSVSMIVVLVLGLIGYAVYDNASNDDNDNADNPTVLNVNDRSFDMNYYVKMLRLYGISGYGSSDQSYFAQYVLQLIEDKEVIRQLAPTIGLAVTDTEVDAEIEKQFTPAESSESTPESTPTSITYDTFLKRLKNIGVSEKLYREVIASDLLSKKALEYIGGRDVPEKIPQAHIQGILVDTKGETDAEGNAVGIEDPEKVLETIKARMANGEDFAALAEQFSVDASKSKGGDLGWMPSAIAKTKYGNEFDTATSSLGLNVLSEPILYSGTQYWIAEVLGRDESMAPDEDQLKTLQNQAFGSWIEEQRKDFNIENLLNPDMRTLAIEKALG